MTTFGVIISELIDNSPMIVGMFWDFTDADFFRWSGISTLFSKTLTFFSHNYAHLGEKLNLSTANDSTFTVTAGNSCQLFLESLAK